jgi:hypothetical protein
MADEYLSSDFSYKKYSLEHLENWLHDALNCEDLTPQDIYDTVVKCVDESVEYHKKYLTKSIELLSLLKGHRPNVFDASAHEFDDFWYEQDEISQHYTEEDLNAMCDKAASDQEKEKCREYNLREAEYYAKRAELDAKHSQYYYDTGRNKTYDQMIEEGWEMTDDGFWIKEK